MNLHRCRPLSRSSRLVIPLLPAFALAAPAVAEEAAETRVLNIAVAQGEPYAVLVGATVNVEALLQVDEAGNGSFCALPGVTVALYVQGEFAGDAVTSASTTCTQSAVNVSFDYTIPPDLAGTGALDIEVVFEGTESFAPVVESRTAPISIVGHADYGGLWETIENANRLAGTDLNEVLTGGLHRVDRANSPAEVPVGPQDRRFVAYFHGWNGTPASGQWGTLRAAFEANWPEGWELIPYDWSDDAEDSLLREAFGARRVSTRAYQHGIVFAELLLQQTEGNVAAVHLLGHSAGVWAAYSAAAYLHHRGPEGLQIQVTHLDPFVPDMLSSHSFTLPFLEESSAFTRNDFHPGSSRAETYWAQDNQAVGTNHPNWSWDPAEGTVLLRVDTLANAGANGWTGHTGPVKFYADTISNPAHPNAEGNGWARSLAFNMPMMGNVWMLH